MKIASTLTSQIAVDGNTKLMGVTSLLSSILENSVPQFGKTCLSKPENLTKIREF